jgi:hypothetical protein
LKKTSYVRTLLSQHKKQNQIFSFHFQLSLSSSGSGFKAQTTNSATYMCTDCKRTSIYPFRSLVAWGDATHGNIYYHYIIKCRFADIQTKDDVLLLLLW